MVLSAENQLQLRRAISFGLAGSFHFLIFGVLTSWKDQVRWNRLAAIHRKQVLFRGCRDTGRCVLAGRRSPLSTQLKMLRFSLFGAHSSVRWVVLMGRSFILDRYDNHLGRTVTLSIKGNFQGNLSQVKSS